MMRVTFRAFAILVATGLSVSAGAQNAPRRRPSSAPYKSNPQQPKKRASVHDQFSGQGYGTAGCGLGSVVFGPKPGLIQIVAVTLNGTSGNQTFGITTGTLNCDIPENGGQAAAFIEVNKEVVRKEAARGQGDSIRALAEIMDCGGEEKLGAEFRGNYGHYLGDSINSYETIRRLIKSGTCTAG
jgi:hypothetical protein